MLLQAYIPALHSALGIFIPLIAVNCIILGRAEMFASKHNVIDSVFDGLGMGLGFTLALFLMGTIREILGSGAFLGFAFLSESVPPMMIFMLAPGGFFVFAVLVILMDKYSKRMKRTKQEFGCEGCPAAASCGQSMEIDTSDRYNTVDGSSAKVCEKSKEGGCSG